MLDLLTAVDKSLVVHQPNDDRYRLLETIRQYLLDRWDENRADVVYGLRQTHEIFRRPGRNRRHRSLGVPRQAEWLNRFESDHDNLRSALSWSRSACGNADAGVQMAGATYLFWERRGFLREGREQLALALAAGSKKVSMYRARAINRAGILAFRQSDYPAARLFYEEALAMWRELGDSYGTATTLNNLSVLTRQQSDLDAARAFNERVLAISREIGHRWLTALCLINLGPTIHDQGHSNEGRQMLEESLAITRDLGDSSLIAHSLHELGLIAFDMQDFTAARSFHEECIAIWRPMGAKLSVATNLSSLALCLHELGDRRIISVVAVRKSDNQSRIGQPSRDCQLAGGDCQSGT